MPNALEEGSPIDPETAYDEAPSMDTEIQWVRASQRAMIDLRCLALDPQTAPAVAAAAIEGRRLYHLRRAALLDRVALRAADPHWSVPPLVPSHRPHVRDAENAARRYQKIVCPDRPALPMEAREYVRSQYHQLTDADRHAPVITGSYADQEPIPHG